MWLTEKEQFDLLEDGATTKRIRRAVMDALREALASSGLAMAIDKMEQVYKLAERIEANQRKGQKLTRNIAAKVIGDIDAFLK